MQAKEIIDKIVEIKNSISDLTIDEMEAVSNELDDLVALVDDKFISMIDAELLELDPGKKEENA